MDQRCVFEILVRRVVNIGSYKCIYIYATRRRRKSKRVVLIMLDDNNDDDDHHHHHLEMLCANIRQRRGEEEEEKGKEKKKRFLSEWKARTSSLNGWDLRCARSFSVKEEMQKRNERARASDDSSRPTDCDG